jgi:DNA-binding response OmpR family regulator
MKKLLLVDDDAVILRSYRDRLSAHGFQVNTASDGASAKKILGSARPDLVVLDLMMPDISGVDVLKFIRGEPRLADLPVIVLTNSYLNQLGREAATIGIQGAMLKAQCSPSVLMSEIDALLARKPAAAEKAPPAPAAPPSSPAPAAQWPATKVPAPVAPSQDTDPASKAGARLLEHGTAFATDLRKLFQAVAHAPANNDQQKLHLQDFYRKVHFLTATAGATPYKHIAQMSAVFEALLYELIDKPSRINPSVLRTLASLVDSTELLFQQARESRSTVARSARVLVVDDDPIANRLAVTALKQAELNPRSTEDSLEALKLLQQERFDVVLLDIEMPGLDGLELCKRLRTMPAYAKTPVVYVTIHADFQTRARSTLAGADDLIAKPILPIELAAKVLMHLLKADILPTAPAPPRVGPSR